MSDNACRVALKKAIDMLAGVSASQIPGHAPKSQVLAELRAVLDSSCTEQEPRIDHERREGAYVTSAVYPPGGGLSVTLFKVERVSGDCTVNSVCFTPDEAGVVVKGLTEGLRLLREVGK